MGSLRRCCLSCTEGLTLQAWDDCPKKDLLVRSALECHLGLSGGLLPAPWRMAYNMLYAKDLLPFQESGILVYARQRLLTWPAPSKNSEHWAPNELPGQHALREGLSALQGVHRERTLGSLCLVSSRVRPMSLSLCWFCLVSFCYNTA